jgi:streptogramin lyase
MKSARRSDRRHHAGAYTLLLCGLLQTVSASALTPTGTITEFTIPTPLSYPLGIAAGPDGNLWFTETQKIGRITPAGVITEFPLSVLWSGSGPNKIAAGPDGNLWFTETDGSGIGKITTNGAIGEYGLPNDNSNPTGITTGPDGNVWFAESPCPGGCNVAFGPPTGEVIGRITPSGTITEFTTTSDLSIPGSFVQGITTGADGNLWFTEGSNSAIGRITPAGVVTDFPVPDQGQGTIVGVTKGPDGNVWFVVGDIGCGLSPHCNPAANPVGKITPAGVVTEFPLPDNGGLTSIVSGSDGNLWFTDASEVQGQLDKIGRITTAGVIKEFPLPTSNSLPIGIASGADGNIWFVESLNNKIGRITVGTTGFTGNWYNPDQSGHGFSIEVLPGNTMLAEWYVFAPTGGQAWIVATGPLNGTTAALQGFQSAGPGALFPPNFNAAQVEDNAWGTITFSFSDCNNAQVSWQPTAAGYSSGSMPIKRLTTPVGVSCP